MFFLSVNLAHPNMQLCRWCSYSHPNPGRRTGQSTRQAPKHLVMFVVPSKFDISLPCPCVRWREASAKDTVEGRPSFYENWEAWKALKTEYWNSELVKLVPSMLCYNYPPVSYLYSPIKSRWVSDPWSPPAVGWARCHDWARSSIGGARHRGRRGMATDGRVHTSGPQTITNPNRRNPNCSSAATVNIHSIQLLRW